MRDTPKKEREIIKMFNFFKKTITTYTVTYKFDGVIYTENATSGGLVSLDSDPYVEIISVEKN
jgi:hypothetical protein